jgi:GT2 family glycosyltransferase
MTPPPATTWHWQGMEGDWGYPMSLDGHIFRTAQIAPLLERLPYRNPNELEAVLADAPLALAKVTCFDVARIVNVPDNRVQDTAPNRHGGGSAARFTPALLAGRRLDLEPFVGLAVPSVHHEMPLRFAADGAAPRVSVVIPCHDMAATLPETRASVAAQELDGGVEVILVDDGSTDGSGDVAAALGATVVRQPASGHPAHARNAGFAAAAAPYVLPLDADDLLEPGFLAATVAALDADGAAGFAYGDVREFGGGQPDELHVTGAWDFVELTHRNRHGSASLVRHEAWQAAGGYDAGLGYEDWDLWLGLGHAGWRGVKAPGATFAHRRGDSGRWALDKGRDRETKARFVLKRPALYDVSQQRWAEAVLRGDPMMASLGNEEGVIPSFVAPAAIDSRRFAVAALAEEILSDPDLLRAYGGAFGADDDVSLVIYGQSHLLESLGAAVAAAGVDGPGSPDLLAVGGGIFQAAAVAASSGALLTRRAAQEPFAALPRFDAATLTDLRRLAVPELAVAVAPALAPTPAPAPEALTGYPAEAPDGTAKREHLLSLFRARGHRTVLESGTFMGDTVEYFMPHAARIISVEVEPKLFADAQRKFEGVANVELVLGDALHVIPEIIARLDDPPLVWLDGHFSEGVTGSGDEIEPAASILARLGAVGTPKGTTLVVDDLRLFGQHPDFPGLDELVERARQGFPEARIRVGLDSLVIEA